MTELERRRLRRAARRVVRALVRVALVPFLARGVWAQAAPAAPHGHVHPAVAARDAAPAAVAPFVAEDRATDWAAGVPYATFRGADTTLAATWATNDGRAAAPVAAVLPRVRAVGGAWRLLIVAEPWCRDAASALPYLAALAARSGGVLELRVLRKAEAPALLAAHPLDGRGATPLVLVLDAEGIERGAWIERPSALAALIKRKEARSCERVLAREAAAWRDADGGRAVLDEVVAVLERAARGTIAAR